jgi:hypothetical protein
MHIFQAYGKRDDGSLVTGVLLGEDQAHALQVAVRRIKDQCGPGSRVTKILPIIDVGDVRRIKHIGIAQALSEFDQVQFTAYHLRLHMRKLAGILAQLIETVKEIQDREEQDK